MFLLDQEIDALKLVERLKKQLELLKKLTPQERDVFLNWIKKIIIQSMPQGITEEVNRLLKENKEVETMVYNLEVALKKEFVKLKQEGLQEGIQKGLQKGADRTKRDIARKMLKKGLNVEEVAEFTSLSEADVESILSEIGH